MAVTEGGEQMNEFEDLKVGDLVVMHASYCDNHLMKVERVTKSQIVVGGTHYWKKDGLLVGRGNWSHGYIRRATEKDIEFFNRVKQKNELLTFIRKVAWCNLSLDSLQTICDVVKKEIGNSAAKH